MSTIPVNLPDDLKSYVDENAKQGGFASASEYIVALVSVASQKQNDLELALMSGLSSGHAEPWTKEEWQAIKNRVVEHGSK